MVRYKFGIITAFSDEINEFLKSFNQQLETFEFAGRRFFTGIIEEKLVVITISGIGISNAAMTTQLMIDKFNPRYLLFSGIAGGINPSFRIGDIVITKRWIQYQHQKTIRSTPRLNNFFDYEIDFPDRFFRFGKNKVLSFKRVSCNQCKDKRLNTNAIVESVAITTNMDIPMYVETFKNGEDAFEEPVPQQFFFPVSRRLLRAAKRVILKDNVLSEPITDGETIMYFPKIEIGDAGLSASSFIDNAEYRRDLFAKFQEADIRPDILDMETAAFAHVATSNRKPFLGIRSMSDLAGGIASSILMQRFLDVAANNSVLFIKKLIAEV